MSRARSHGSRFLSGLFLLASLLLAAAAANAQTIFTEAFDGSWTNPPSLLTGGQPWSGIGTGNNEWHRNDYTTGWTSTSGAYSPTGALSTTNSARWHTYDATSGTTGSLITPTIDFSSNAGNKRVTFYSINTSGTDVVRVYLSTDGGSTYGTSLTTIGLSSAWTQYTVPLGTTTSSTVKIKFEATGDFGLTDIGVDQMVVEVYTPLTGTKIVGAGGDYTTMTAAINALNSSGVGAGGLTFNVIAGSTFTEDVPVIVATIGSSAANPVVFQRSGAGANPVIKPTGGAGTADFGFGITGADYVTVDGIDITENTGSAVEYGYLVKNASSTDGATNVTIKNCVITLNRANTSSYGIVQTSSSSLGGGTTPASLAGSNSSNKYQNFTVTNSYNGIALYGGSATYIDASNEVGVTSGGSTFIGGAAANDIGNGGSTCYGVRAITQSGLKVSGITVRNATITSSITLYGIWIDNSSSGTYVPGEFSNNTVTGLTSTSTSSSSVIYGIRADLSTGNSFKVANNDIYAITPAPVTSATTTQVLRALGVNVGSNAGTVNVYYNSVHIGSGLAGANLNGTSAAFYQAGGTSNLANNIFSNVTPAQTTSKHYGAYISSGTLASSSNNVFWTPNTNGVLGYQSATDRTTLQIFAAAVSPTAPVDGAEGGSANADPGFASATNLTFAGSTPAALSGIPVSGITTDITGAARSATRPTIGAHETANAQNDQSAPALGGVSITSSATPTVSVTLTDNSAAGSNATVQLWYRLGSSGAFTGVDADIKPAGAMNGTYTWNTSIAGLAAGSYQFYIAARDAGGAGTRIWANPIWTTSFPTSGGFAAGDPPNYGTNPATYANIRSFTKTVSLAGGTYDVGSDQVTLKKLTDVAAQLNGATLLGDVVYELNSTYDGTTGETFPVTFNQLSTSGGNWTVTVRVKSGAGARTTRGKSGSAIIKLTGGDRFTFDGREGGAGSTRAWTVANDSTGTATAGIWVSSLGTGAGAASNTVRYLNLATGIDPTTSSNEGFGIISSGSTISSSSDGLDNDSNTFANNAITKARWGIYVRGASANTNDNVTISGNLVGPAAFGTDQIAKGGIVLQHQQAAVVTQNEVRFVGVLVTQTAGGTDRVGIGLGDYNWTPTATTMQNCSVTRNLVHDIVEEKTFSAVGIDVAGTTAPTNNTVANNIVYNVRADGTSGDQGVGIGIGAGDNDKVVYNSIALTGDQDPSTSTTASYPTIGIRISTTSVTNLTLKNNVISSDVTSNTSTLHHAAIVVPATSYLWGTGGSDNNDYYVNTANTQMVLGGIGTTPPYTDVTTLAGWRTQFTPNQDAASVAAQPPFVSATDLHLNASIPTALESGGTPIAAVTVDYDNEARNGTTPDIGADEGAFTSLTANDMAATAFISPANGGSVAATVAFTPQASFTNTGTISLTNIPVRYRILNNVSAEVYNQTATIASLGAGAVTTVSFPAATLSAAGVYSIIAKAELAGDGVPANDSLLGSITAFTPLSGTYTVGVGGAYTTLTAAVAALNGAGAAGAVTFSLTDATYPSETFPITVTAWPGASPSNTLTIKPAAGVAASITGSATTAILKLSGADYVTVDGSNAVGGTTRDLTISNSSTSTTSSVIWLSSPTASDGATNNVLKNLVVRGNSASTTLMAIYSGGTSISTTAPVIRRQRPEPNAGPSVPGVEGAAALTANSNNTYSNNLVAKAQYGLFAIGTSTTTLDAGLVVSGNSFGTAAAGDGFQNAALWMQYQSGAVATQNDIQNVVQSGSLSGDFYAVEVKESKSVAVERNKIHGIVYSGTSSAKIFALNQQGSAFITSGNASANRYANNMLYDMTSTSTSGFWALSAINNEGGYGDTYAFNSVSLTGALSGGASATVTAFSNGNSWNSGSATNLDVRDNVFSVTGSSASATKFYGHYTGLTSYTGSTLNYNDLIVTPTGSAVGYTGRFNSVDYSTLASWRTATGQEANSYAVAAPFVSATDLHLNASIPTALESGGTPVAAVAVDFDGESRNVTTPDVGADEGAFTSLTAVDMAATAFISPANGGSVAAGVAFTPQASFTNTGTIAQSSVTVRYRILDATLAEVYNQTEVIASIAGGAVTTVSFPSATVSSAGSYSIVAKAELAGDGVPANDVISGSITAYTPLSGTYTVGGGGAYPTLTAAVASLNTVGASGAVTFSLIDATYPGETLPITLAAWPGASAVNSLTIKPASGVTATISGASTSAILKLSGADYVTLDGSNNGSSSRDLTLTNTSTSTTSAVIWLSSPSASDGATHNTLKNVIVNGNASTTTLMGVYSGGTTISTAAPVAPQGPEQGRRLHPQATGITAALANNSDNTYQNISVGKAQYGIFLIGTSTTTLDTNNQIIGSAIGTPSAGLGLAGVWLKYQSGALVLQNDIQNISQTGSSGSSFYGIEVADTKLSTVSRNLVHAMSYNGTSTGKIWAIDQSTSTFTTSGNPSSNLYANNMVYDLTSNSVSGFWSMSGINCDSGYGDKYYYNSVSVTGAISGASTAWAAALSLGTDWNAVSPTNTDVRDNILSMTGSVTTATPVYALHCEALTLTGSVLDYNNEYAAATGSAINYVGRLNGVDYTTLASWRTATGQEAASQSVLAPFVSSTDLHLVAASGTTLESAGTPVPVTIDYDGQTRNATTPDIGADEGNFLGNRPPVIASIPDQVVNENTLLTVTPSAGDPDGDVLTFSGSNLPTGAAVNASSGVLSWTPDYTQSGIYLNVTITATDPSLASASRSFKITVNNVNRPPVMNSVSAKTMNEAQTLVVDVSATDPDNESLVFSLVSISPAPPSGVLPTVVDSLPTHATFKWTPTYFDGSVTPYVMTVKVVDPSNAQAATQFNVTVTNIDGPPFITDRADTTVFEATTSTVTLKAVEPDCQTIRWSLLAPAPPWASLTNNSGPTVGLTFKPGYASADSTGSAGAGADSIKVIASDGTAPGALRDTTVFILHITNVNRLPVLAAISNQTVAEGSLLSFTASATDPDQPYDVLTWALTGAPSTASINPSNGLFTWTPSFTAAERVPGGIYGGLTVTVTDNHGASNAKSFQVTVTNTNRQPVVSAIGDQTVVEGALLTVTPSASDPDTTDTVASWAGSSLPSGASVASGTGVLSWTPGFTQAGVYPGVTLTATDNHGANGSASFQITVTNTNQAPTVNAISDQTVAENALLTVTPSGSDPDGDVLSWSGSSLPSGASVASGTGVLSWTPGYAQAGVYPGVTLTADDGNGGSASASFQITVTDSNRSPVVAAITDTTVVGDDVTPLSIVPSASDPDGDAVTWSGSGLPAGASVNATTGELTWTPQHTQGGAHSITLIADDGLGGTGSVTFQVTVTVPTGIELTVSKLGVPATFGIPVVGQMPFRRSVEFVVGTPTAGTIAVSVLDARGRVVATLAPRTATPGYVMFRWDGSGAAGRPLASGVYYLRASTGHAVATQRVVKMD